MMKYALGGAALVTVIAVVTALFLFGKLGAANKEIGKANATSEVVIDANKGKSDAVKERARTDHDVRQLPDPQLLEQLR